MKNKFLFLTILLLIGLSSTTKAQQEEGPIKKDIQLVDGSVLKGIILEQTDQFIKIKIINGDVLLLDHDLIATFGKSIPINPRIRGSALRKKGFYNIISTGLLAGRDAQLQQGLILDGSLLHYVRGYQFNQYLGVGMGVGFDSYNTGFLPIYVDLRGNQNLGKITFFYSLQSGYAITKDDFGGNENEWSRDRGGLMVYPAVGFKVPTKTNMDILFEFGLKNQWSTRQYNWDTFEDDIIYRRYSFRIGFAF